MTLILNTLLLVSVAFLSFIFRKRIALLHNLSIEKISFKGIHGVRYQGVLEGDVHFDFTIARLSLRFHFPTTPNPRWLTIEADALLYKSNTCDICVGSLIVTCWFFPRLLRQTAGPWADAKVDDFRIRVMSSDAIPHYVQMLRANIVDAVLTGEILRVDDFSTAVRFAGLSEAEVEQHDDTSKTMPDGGIYNEVLDGHRRVVDDTLADENGSMKSIRTRLKRRQPVPFLSKDQDEIRISAFAKGLHIHNRQGRYYSFASVNAQHRRNWTANRGTFVLIASESRWVKLPRPYEMVAPSPWVLQLLTSITHFPYDLMRCYYQPLTMVNLYVPRVDVTFDNFRMRDAELVVQGLAMIRQSMAQADIQWSDVFADCVANAAISILNS